MSAGPPSPQNTKEALQLSIRFLQERLAKLEAELEEIRASKSWRVTAPLRSSRRIIGSFKSLHKAPGRAGRMLFHGLPVSDLTRSRVRNAVYRSFGPLLRNSDSYRFWAGQRQEQAVSGELTADVSFEELVKRAGEAPLAFTEVATPRVSIVIPAFNEIALTRQCLASLVQLTSTCPFEVIVIDDASEDETPEVLQEIQGLRFLRNEENLGFLKTCNRAALKARGEFIVFLNNDTVVVPGWLDELLATFEARPDAGLVGSRLVYPSGRLQEAGGLVFEDGSAANAGRDSDPDEPAWNYLREVDYCSAASLMIKAELFRKLGGFDETYAPAYYEDTDLAMRVRSAGYKVYCQPLSMVYHVEGGTAGIDLAQGMKAYQVINQRRFHERWHEELKKFGPPDLHQGLARDRWCRSHAVVVDVWPRPDRDSGSIDTVNLLENLRDMGFKVSFIPENTSEHFGAYTRALQRAGIECWYAPYLGSFESWLETQSTVIDLFVLRRHAASKERLAAIRNRFPEARVVYDTVDLNFLRLQREAESLDSDELRAEAARKSKEELSLVRDMDATIVVSPAEEELLNEVEPDAIVHCIPFQREIFGRKADFDSRRDIVFIGNYMHTPNVDAVTWFVEQVWPGVSEILPEARFRVIGSDLPNSLRKLGGERVDYLGYVEDLDQVFERARISVAPLRFGAGIKGKVATSLSHGVPVVATTIAAEGMGGTDGEHWLLAEEAGAFAEAVVKSYRDPQIWRQLSDGGMKLVESIYSAEAGRQRLAALLSDLGLAGDPADSFRVETPGPKEEWEPAVQAIAFYLPQFHPIEENDRWWGRGFTEWTNVSRARPLFPGHYQPHLPADLGFYDLRLPEARAAQAELAQEAGIGGFCYYHYWFGGRRLLERPFESVLSSGTPDLPFCLCWANENWTRRWDGLNQEILMAQDHSDANDRAFIRDLFRAFDDPRYIRIAGKPLLLVYRTEILPDAARTAEIWREECHKAGIGEIHLCRGETFSIEDPAERGFDSSYEFPPLLMPVVKLEPEEAMGPEATEAAARFNGRLHSYEDLADYVTHRKAVPWRRFNGVSVSWDNSARVGDRAMIWLDATPERYARWLMKAAEQTVLNNPVGERILFINAWNEWAEGCHLEPDQHYGHGWLTATRAALAAVHG